MVRHDWPSFYTLWFFHQLVSNLLISIIFLIYGLQLPLESAAALSGSRAGFYSLYIAYASKSAFTVKFVSLYNLDDHLLYIFLVLWL